MRNLFCIVGINGVGKTAVSIKAAAELRCEYVSSSGVLKNATNVSSSSDLEQFDQSELNKTYILAMLGIAKRATGPVILDSHSVVFMEDGAEDVTQNPELYPYFVTIINIVANPTLIKARIESDNQSGEKVRKFSLNKHDIIYRQNRSSQEAMRMAEVAGIPYIELKNNGLFKLAVKELCNAIR